MSYQVLVLDLEEEIHVGDTVQFLVAIVERDPDNPTGPKLAVDIASGTAQLKFSRPNGSGFTRAMAIVGPTADGVFGYTCSAGDLDVTSSPGKLWKAQAAVDLSAGPSGWSGHAQQFAFAVFPNLSGA